VKILRVAREEALDHLDVRAIGGRLLCAPLPHGVGNRLRTHLLRAAGLSIGDGTTVAGTPRITGGRQGTRNVRIGRDCFINIGCIFDASAAIDLGDGVSLGQEVVITTSSHDASHPRRRGGTLTAEPIRVGDGAWIAARAVLLPGVTVGAGAVVMAGAVVARAVTAHTMVGGVPARVVRELDPGDPTPF
jgi:maltose O-acetyltransferase